MGFSVQLDTVAAAGVFGLLSTKLMERWLATNPSSDELEEFAQELRMAVKNAHANNALPDTGELLLVERMSFHLEEFLERNPLGR